MQTETVRRVELASHSRQMQLTAIMKDAVEHVLERDDNRRGPYVIDDQDLRDIPVQKTIRNR